MPDARAFALRPERPTIRRSWLGLSALLALAAALRVRALFTDFWLDEIWSYEQFARRAHSVGEIFLGATFKHDNNQQINTLILYLIGDQRAWAVYRLPAFAAGLCTVAAAWWVGSRRGVAEGWISGLVVALSFVMVVYSTEARGYAWLLLFALAAFEVLRRYLDHPSAGRAVHFWIWIALGLTASLTIAHLYLGALLWSGYRLRRNLRSFLVLHALPAVTAVVWALAVLRGAAIGGGPTWTWSRLGDESLAWTLGYPLHIVPTIVAAAVAGALVLADAWMLWRESSDEGLFTVAVVMGPPVLMAALDPPWLFPRYFLVSLLFLLLVAARCLARLWRSGTRGRVAVAVLLGAMAVGNLMHIVPFSEYGRGGASRAIQFMADHSRGGTANVTGEPVDLWTSLPLAFYARTLGLDGKLQYIDRSGALEASAAANLEWLVIENLPGEPDRAAPAPRVHLATGATFELRAAFPAYGPSGIDWLVYERVRAATP